MDPVKLAHAIHVEKVYKSCHDSMQIATERCVMPKVIEVYQSTIHSNTALSKVWTMGALDSGPNWCLQAC